MIPYPYELDVSDLELSINFKQVCVKLFNYPLIKDITKSKHNKRERRAL